MRKGIISALIGTAIFVGGCQTSSVKVDPVGPNDPNFTEVVQKNEETVKAHAIIGTSSILLMIDGGDQAEAAKSANRLANDVKRALTAGELNVTDIQKYAVDLVVSSDSKDKEAVGLLLNNVVTLVRSNLNLNFENLTVQVKDEVATKLALAAIEGVLEATQPYVR